MKKKAIALAVLTMTLFAASCQKENEITPTGKGMTINAVSEGIGADAKADLAYKYDVIWKMGDEICVRNSQKSVRFTLVAGEETTKGTFSSTGDDISGEVEGFYPAGVANLIWPAEQQNNQVPPMYCKKTLSSTQNQTFNFASLGSVLQLNFYTTTADIVLKSIEVKADEAMSGAFTIENGQAKISQPEGSKPGIILDFGNEGVKLGTSAKKFNIAVPAGEYHGLSVVFTATNGKECTINAKKDKAIEMVFNTVNTLAISGEFKAPSPLAGKFTVNEGGKKVHFSRGNLWADGSKALHSEKAQWKTTPTSNGPKDGNHMSHFTWSSTVEGAVSDGNSGSYLFCDNNHKQCVDCSDAMYYALSQKEWEYLFKKHSCKGATVNGVNGCVIAPDNFSGTIASSYADDAALATENLVFLPAAGSRSPNGQVYSVGSNGFYWSSSQYDDGDAYFVFFDISLVSTGSHHQRYIGCSVRLVTDAK